MASTFSSLKIELIGTGEQDGTWSTTTNTNLGTTIEQAITGSGNVTFASADVTLTLVNSNSAQTARNLRLVCVGVSGGSRQLIVPAIEKQYIVKNELADSVTIRNSTGTGVTVPSGKSITVFNDATNVVEVNTYAANLTATTLTYGGVTLPSTVSGTGSMVLANSPALTGTPTAPTAAPGTNTTQIATTAFVQQVAGNLGTMSTQNANNVVITGGTITGITDLAVADGGTGRSTLPANAVLVGNGVSGINSIAPGAAGSILTSNGTTWVSGAGASSLTGAGGLSNGTSFNINTGSSGIALITVEFLSVANYGNFGGANGYLAINGSTVASKYTQTIEYDGRTTGCGGVILYRYVGTPNTTVTGTFSWSGSGSFNSASYMYMGM
jgi:hypothetical protein